MTSSPIEVAHDELWPRVPEMRYRVYSLDGAGAHVVRRAAGDDAGVGAAIFDHAEERRSAGLPPDVVAVYDAIDRRWLTTPWAGKDRP